MSECTICDYEDITLESFPHYPCGPQATLAPTVETEPPQWADGDWWKSTNSIRDVGEQHALARREANRLRSWAFQDEMRWAAESRTVAAYHPGPDYPEPCDGFAWPSEHEKGIPAW